MEPVTCNSYTAIARPRLKQTKLIDIELYY